MEKFTPDAAHIEKATNSDDAIVNLQLDKRLNRKFDVHILPWLFGIWLFSFIDRSNIGNARIAGLAEELHITHGTSFNVALLVFYIPYILVDVPSNLLVKKLRAGVYLPTLITAWGLVCTFMGFVQSFAGLVVCRLLLGLFEGGILGGVIIYLAMFYRRHEMLLRSGLFYCAAPLSGAFGGLLASGLARIEVGGYNKWPWIFFIEGAVTVVFGIVCFFFMPDTPAAAHFLNDEEKEWALRRMRLDAHGSSAVVAVDDERFSWYWMKMALTAPQTYFCSIIWFFLLVPLYSFSLFLPSIIRGMGYQSTTAQLFTVPPNMAAFFTVLLTAYCSDKVKNRGYFIVGGSVLGICGYIMMLVAKNNAVRYAGTFLVAIGVFQGSPMVMGWASNNLAPHYVRAVGIGIVISIANCSAFIGTFIYLQRDSPKYALGHSVSLGALVLTLVLALAQIMYLNWENKKRDRGERDDRLLQENVGQLGHRHPSFRYTL
ncbi:MFS general substrate transporter [Cucurbitaria berberidis CBS 394.84]|uniref:MFS general substrate transporter n=1 Tax=Cucurbitaria berberidis CBS 394.84 TaxID=1168544 RepID=A0A9P4L8E6_9PLEO|nr:MFS general substrate transporter [Cucurbitaria berberidis CBS 394.84]KAF1846006.1 MFS general substrate transporter [Cucurbitaria berberidis CBS 394.84]